MNSKEKAWCMAQQCAPHSTVAGGCRAFLCLCSGISFEIGQHWELQGKRKKQQKAKEENPKTPKLQRTHRKTAQRIFTCHRHRAGRSSLLVSGQGRSSIQIQKKSPCQGHQPWGWGTMWERGSCGCPHHRAPVPLPLRGILAYMDPEVKKATCFEEESNLFPYVWFRSGCLGSNTLLLSERVCGLQLCYQVSESPLGQGLWEQMLTSASQQENKPQQ